MRPAPAPVPVPEVGVLLDVLLRTVLPVGVLLGLALAVYGGTGHDLTVVLQDRFPEDSEFSGLFTVLFSAALLVGAGVSLGAVVVAHRYGRAATPAARAGTALAVLLVVVGTDDVLMVHDSILPGAGVPEGVGLGAYGLVGVVLAVVALRPMREEGYGLAFAAALALLACSLGGDVVESLLEGPAPAVARAVGHAEDVVKFLGYAALCHVCVLVALRVAAHVVEGVEREEAGPGPRTAAAVLPPLRTAGPPPRLRAATPDRGPRAADPELTAPLSLPRVP